MYLFTFCTGKTSKLKPCELKQITKDTINPCVMVNKLYVVKTVILDTQVLHVHDKKRFFTHRFLVL